MSLGEKISDSLNLLNLYSRHCLSLFSFLLILSQTLSPQFPNCLLTSSQWLLATSQRPSVALPANWLLLPVFSSELSLLLLAPLLVLVLLPDLLPLAPSSSRFVVSRPLTLLATRRTSMVSYISDCGCWINWTANTD